MKFIKKYLNNYKYSFENINTDKLNEIIVTISKMKKNGRIFFLGVGGSAANCSHAVNDFRKLCNIESYAITDNQAELTARINDEGWNSSYVNYLKISKLNSKDILFIFSVGGGNIKKKVSVNIIECIKYAKKKKSKILGITGNIGGYTSKNADIVIKVPIKDNELITPLSESFQSIIWHCIVSDPRLKINETKW